MLEPGDLDEARGYVEGGAPPSRDAVRRILEDHRRLREDVVDLTTFLARTLDPANRADRKSLEEVAAELGIDLGALDDQSNGGG